MAVVVESVVDSKNRDNGLVVYAASLATVGPLRANVAGRLEVAPPAQALAFVFALRSRVGRRYPRQTRRAQGSMRALRLLIRNTGATTAHGITVNVIEFSYFPLRGRPGYLFDEVLDLARALTERGRAATFDLGPKSHRWIDLAFSDDFGVLEPLRFGFASPTPARLPLMGFGHPGLYDALVVATPENAEASRPRRPNWYWDGTPRVGLSALWTTPTSTGL